MLIPAAYFFQADRFFLLTVTLNETTGAGMYIAYLPIFIVRAPALVGVLIDSALVSAWAQVARRGAGIGAVHGWRVR